MSNRILLFLSLITLTGCNDPTKVSAPKLENSTINVTYVRDFKTDLCFAVLASSTYGAWNVYSLTNVPCSDKVVKEIK